MFSNLESNMIKSWDKSTCSDGFFLFLFFFSLKKISLVSCKCYVWHVLIAPAFLALLALCWPLEFTVTQSQAVSELKGCGEKKYFWLLGFNMVFLWFFNIKKPPVNRNFQFIFSTIVTSVIPHLSPTNIILEGIPSEAQISVVPLGRRKVERASVSYLDESLPYIYLIYLPSNILRDFFGMPEQSFSMIKKNHAGEEC